MKKVIALSVVAILLLFYGCGSAQVKKEVIKSVQIIPADVKVKVGKTVALTAQCLSESGKVLEGKIEWSVDNKNLGTLSDIKDTSAVFNAKKAGTAVVKATCGEVAGEAKIVITK